MQASGNRRRTASRLVGSTQRCLAPLDNAALGAPHCRYRLGPILEMAQPETLNLSLTQQRHDLRLFPEGYARVVHGNRFSLGG